MVNKATVKNVLSGDTVILRGKPRANGPPAERLMALSNVQAPRLGNTTRSDEPFGYGAREFLRKLLVGKEVSFVSEYTVPTTQREYGCIYLPTGENVAELGVKNGWLKVREGQKTTREGQEEVLEKLEQLQAEAQDAKLGMWNDAEKGTREVSFTFDRDGHAFLSKYKGKPLDAVIEQVRDGATFRILLILPDQTQQIITLHLSGIKAPSCKRDNAPADDQSVSEPFGEECKFFVESRLLQRGVKVILEGLSQSGGQTFVGSVQHPAGNIAELLLSQGLAKCVDWSITLATCGPAPLRQAEKAAKEKKLRIWRDFVAKKVDTNATEFDATVVRIVTGDMIIVKTKTGVEKKLQLASVKQAPRGAGTTTANSKSRDIKEVGYQFEAREFLRKKLIGKQAHITIDYHKPAQDGFEARDCATVIVSNHNIAEQLIVRGLATAIRHRKDDDNRSHCYDQLLIAEKKAEEDKRGIHSPKEQPVVRIVDASENAAKSRQFLTFLKRSGKVNAVVDFVANGSRLFVWVPKENCRLTFVLSGVRAPRVGRTANDKSEPYGQEALDFVSQKCLQHDVEIEIENVDKIGSFVGSLFVNGENLAVSLLSRGLATIHEYSADESNYVNQLYGAEREAKTEKRGIWSGFKEEVVEEKAANAGPNREYIDVVVSDIISGSHFYVQKVTDEIAKLKTLMSELGQYQNARPADPSFRPRVGENVSAKFTEDDCWYRGRVRRISHEGIEVLYIDFGNSETLPNSRVRSLPENFKQLKAQAHEAVLSFVKSPEVTEDYGIEAVECFKDFTADKQLVANVDAREGNVMCLTLFDFRKSASAEDSVNLDMVSEGQAYVTPKVRYARGNETILKALQGAQEEAIKRRRGMFEYGDITGNEDVTSTHY
ncbi:hypothetical protein BDF21DRAFT_455425 [Thamnidium elegans]|uniref:Staphylococcal nuclease domain-containing protein n=1 Tax=Thamnidium elegans TaxID=101142 RepID=A0A8H7SN17_9FUNG|nr:hypothetical protein INT48_009297 [Thamnidium elegans]KAI8063092.1 hypothetical protein BDF21DRAFT_455425 [Thamnidium elegans]